MIRRYEAPHRLYGCQLKLDRAYQHVETLDQAVEGFIKRNPHEAAAKVDPEARQYTIWMKVRDTPPLWWSTVVGDAIHNLRSALDHLACQLARANGKSCKRLSYPILPEDPARPETDRSIRETWKTLTKRLHPDDLAQIERTQPYKGRDSGAWRELLMLNRLSNWDKHNALNLTASILLNSQFTVEGINCTIIGNESGFDGPFEYGTVIARGGFIPVIPGEQVEVEMHGDLIYGIAFAESGPSEVAGKPVVVTLMDIANVVHDIVHHFALGSPRLNQNRPDPSTVKG